MEQLSLELETILEVVRVRQEVQERPIEYKTGMISSPELIVAVAVGVVTNVGLLIVGRLPMGVTNPDKGCAVIIHKVVYVRFSL